MSNRYTPFQLTKFSDDEIDSMFYDHIDRGDMGGSQGRLYFRELHNRHLRAIRGTDPGIEIREKADKWDQLQDLLND